MGNQVTKEITVVSKTSRSRNQLSEEVALFNGDGTPFVPLTTSNKAAVQADTTAADLAALKVDFNALLAKLKAAGLMASS